MPKAQHTTPRKRNRGNGLESTSEGQAFIRTPAQLLAADIAQELRNINDQRNVAQAPQAVSLAAHGVNQAPVPTPVVPPTEALFKEVAYLRREEQRIRKEYQGVRERINSLNPLTSEYEIALSVMEEMALALVGVRNRLRSTLEGVI